MSYFTDNMKLHKDLKKNMKHNVSSGDCGYMKVCHICGDTKQIKSYIFLPDLKNSEAEDVRKKVQWLTSDEHLVDFHCLCAICLQKLNSLIKSRNDLRTKYKETQITLKAYQNSKKTKSAISKSEKEVDVNSGENNQLEECAKLHEEEEGCIEYEWLSDQEHIDYINEQKQEIIQKVEKIQNWKLVNNNAIKISRTYNIEDHIVQQENGHFVCSLCGKVLRRREHAEQHFISRHTQEKPFQCKRCDKAFPLLAYLDRHIARIHEADQFVCLKCGLKFSRKYVLAAHERIHAGPPTIQCPHVNCPNKFYAAHVMKAHIANTHAEKLFVCDQCGKQFRTKIRLQHHEQRHYGKTVSCRVCSKLFSTRTDVLVHMKYHRRALPWKCAACNMSFRTTRGLQNHFSISHGEKVSRLDIYRTSF